MVRPPCSTHLGRRTAHRPWETVNPPWPPRMAVVASPRSPAPPSNPARRLPDPGYIGLLPSTMRSTRPKQVSGSAPPGIAPVPAAHPYRKPPWSKCHFMACITRSIAHPIRLAANPIVRRNMPRASRCHDPATGARSLQDHPAFHCSCLLARRSFAFSMRNGILIVRVARMDAIGTDATKSFPREGAHA